jgi:hypothetical protein
MMMAKHMLLHILHKTTMIERPSIHLMKMSV